MTSTIQSIPVDPTPPASGNILQYNGTIYTPVAPNPGDITEVTVSAPITGGGASGSVNIGLNTLAMTLTNTAETHQQLTDAATIAWDMNLGGSADVTLGASRNFGAPTNLRQGATYMLQVIQGGAGSFTITWDAVFLWPGGVAPTLSTAVGAKDVVALYCPDGVSLWGVANLDFS